MGIDLKVLVKTYDCQDRSFSTLGPAKDNHGVDEVSPNDIFCEEGLFPAEKNLDQPPHVIAYANRHTYNSNIHT